MKLFTSPLLVAAPSDDDRLSPAWSVAAGALALVGLLACPAHQRLHSVLISALVCVLVQWFLPQARFRTNHYFSPVNLALLLLQAKILIVPFILMMFGYENKIMALTATPASTEAAILIDTLAFAAFAAGLQLTAGRPARPGPFSLLPALSRTPGPEFILAFAALGFLGLVLTFGSIGRFIEYFSDPAAIVDPQAGAGWGEFFGTILRPFFAFSLVTWWARSVDQSRQSDGRWRPFLIGLATAAGITIANSTFGLNRGAVVFPILALAAVYSARVRRIPPAFTLVAVAVAVPLLLAVGSFRSNSQLAQYVPETSREVEVSSSELTESILVYAGGPQLTGVFYESIDWGRHLYGGQTLLSSVMSPIPILGKGFRDTSGPVVYNHAIYGVSGIDDQIPPFTAELFANLYIAGVVGGFLALAWLLALFESWITAVQSTFGAFIVQYIAVWGAMLTVWSLAVYVQILFYFLGPVYLYLAVLQFRGILRRPAVAPMTHPLGASAK